jgi:type I restriction enzyme M protein
MQDKEILFLSKLSAFALESYIRKAISTLKDLSLMDQLQYVSSILLYKRLNDVFVETATRIEQEEYSSHAWDDQDEHIFFIPKDARWTNLIQNISELGLKINKAMESIERKNDYLSGVFTCVDFNNKGKLTDEMIVDLIQIFTDLEMSDANLDAPSIIGKVFSNVVSSLDSISDSSLAPTPYNLSKLLAELVQPTENMRVCDPVIGMGGCLVEVANYLVSNGSRLEDVTLCGSEKDIWIWALCKRNLILHQIIDAKIEKRDILRSPLVQDNKLEKYDRIISVLPFSQRNWGQEEAKDDGFDRFLWGLPPSTSGDYAFIQHIVSTLKQDGKASIVVPTGVLFRGGIEGEIRKSLIEDDLIEAVILLPSNLLVESTSQTCILVINHDKTKIKKGNVLFIDASKSFQSKKMINMIRDEDISTILATYKRAQTISGYSRLISLKHIKEEEYSLVPSRYIQNYQENVAAIFEKLNSNAVTLGEIIEQIQLYETQVQVQEGESEESNRFYYPLNHWREPALLSLGKQDPVQINNHYAEIVLSSEQADASYVCQFLNSQLGQRLRGILHENFADHSNSSLTLENVKQLAIYLPEVNEQIQRLHLQSKIRNTTTALLTLEQKLWSTSENLKSMESKIDQLIQGNSADNWYESLPYPLAAILLLYARDQNPEAKVHHLFNFFEAFSQFLVTILLSHFYKEKIVLEEVIRKIKEKGYRIGIKNSTFGFWITFGMKLAKAGTEESSFQDLYNYNENAFLKMLTDTSVYELLMEAMKLRNRWKGHGGIDNQEISKKRLVILEDLLSKLNAKIGNKFENVILLNPLNNRFRSGAYYFSIQNLVGSNPHFKMEDIVTTEVMEEGKLYLLHQGEKRPLELVPLLTICMETKACHYYSALTKENGKELVRFVSYHYDKEPEKFEESPEIQTFIQEHLL